MRLSNGFVIDKEKTFGELKFTAVRDVFLQNEDGTPSTQLKKRIYDLKCSLHGGIIPVSVPPEVPLREFPYNAVVELVNPVGTILAVQSLSDSTKYKYRYLTLRRLGINDKSLFKTIRKQLLILFCVPAISAILCSFVMMSSLNNVYQQILGDKHLYLMYFGLNLIIFFLIYSIYWIATYIGFKRNINEAS